MAKKAGFDAKITVFHVGTRYAYYKPSKQTKGNEMSKEMKFRVTVYQNGNIVAQKWFSEADKQKASSYAGVSNWNPMEYSVHIEQF